MSAHSDAHSYEEVRQAVVDSLLGGADQFTALLERVREKLAPPSLTILPIGRHDADLVHEVVWDLFRQGVIIIGKDSSNPNWPWLKLSRFGMQALKNGYLSRFHDVGSYINLIRREVDDISVESIIYLEEAVAAFYSGCMLASVVMLGVAAEAEFLKLVDISQSKYSTIFSKVEKEKYIGSKIKKFKEALDSNNLNGIGKIEDLDTNFSMIQSVLRVARNEAGHPSGRLAPSREQVYVYLQLFIPFAKQLKVLRDLLS